MRIKTTYYLIRTENRPGMFCYTSANYNLLRMVKPMLKKHHSDEISKITNLLGITPPQTNTQQ